MLKDAVDLLSETEYHDALTKLIEGVVGTALESVGDKEIGRFLASVWDDVVCLNTLQALSTVDLTKQRLILKAIAGRTKYGRPVGHPQRKWLEEYFLKVVTQHP